MNTHSDAHQSVVTVLDTFKVAVRQHDDFRKTIQSFQNRLSKDLQTSSEKAEAFFASLTKNLAQSANDLFESVVVSLRNIQDDVTGLDSVRTLLSL